MMKKVLMVLASIIFFINSSFAMLTAEVTNGVIKIPLITIANNNIHSSFATEVNSIVNNDLNHSVKLKANQNIDYSLYDYHKIDWRNIKSDYVVLNKYNQISNSKYNVKVEILNRYNKNYFKSISYNNINIKLDRQLAHKISNFIYKSTTGKKGFFATKIAYVKVKNPYARYGRIYQLIISDYDGYNKLLALSQSEPIATPSWSKNGKYIVYTSYRNGAMGIYRFQISTGKVKQITNFKGINSSPVFSPNGKYIALALSNGYSEDTNIYTLNLFTKKLKRLTINGINTAPNYSSNGKKLIFISNRKGTPAIYITNLNSRVPQSHSITSSNYQSYSPVFANNDKDVIFMFKQHHQSTTQIAKLNLANNKVTILTNGNNDSSPTVSPYGSVFAYVSNHINGTTDIKIASLNKGLNYTVISNDNGEFLLQSPTWSPVNF